ncbi:uncharacterized protein LOC117181776 [Belonocnema kinseyi]|uniref:uncharacterized protein LOC117181776 n=1 Tax=Belonocnema kinseyi TaxID=2817044 RepID=UPI00143D042A|nr:uncharacterized protein LOC117181776 [Belonocnema kinseyi]
MIGMKLLTLVVVFSFSVDSSSATGRRGRSKLPIQSPQSSSSSNDPQNENPEVNSHLVGHKFYLSQYPHPNNFIINFNNSIHSHQLGSQVSPKFRRQFSQQSRPQFRPQKRPNRKDNGPYERHFTVLDSNPQSHNIPSYRISKHPFKIEGSSSEHNNSPQNHNQLPNRAQMDLNLPPSEEKKPFLDLNKIPDPEHD